VPKLAIGRKDGSPVRQVRRLRRIGSCYRATPRSNDADKRLSPYLGSRLLARDWRRESSSRRLGLCGQFSLRQYHFFREVHSCSEAYNWIGAHRDRMRFDVPFVKPTTEKLLCPWSNRSEPPSPS